MASRIILALSATFTTQHPLSQEQAQEAWGLADEFQRVGTNTYKLSLQKASLWLNISQEAEWIRQVVVNLVGTATLLKFTEFQVSTAEVED